MAKKEGKITWGLFIPWVVIFASIGGYYGYEIFDGWTSAVVGGILGGIIGVIAGYLVISGKARGHQRIIPKTTNATNFKRASSMVEKTKIIPHTAEEKEEWLNWFEENDIDLDEDIFKPVRHEPISEEQRARIIAKWKAADNEPTTIWSEIKKAFQPGVSLRDRGCLYWILTIGFFILIAVFWNFISGVFPSLERIYDFVGAICAGIMALFALFAFAILFWDKYISP